MRPEVQVLPGPPLALTSGNAGQCVQSWLGGRIPDQDLLPSYRSSSWLSCHALQSLEDLGSSVGQRDGCNPRPGWLGAIRAIAGGMLAFIRKKFVGSYLALRAVRRVHCWPVYA